MRRLLGSGLLLAALATAFGCRRHEIRVQLPKGYSGKVVLFCSQQGEAGATVVVNEAGMGTGARCDNSGSRLLVVRDGQRITPDGEIRLLKTGDGIPTGIEFEVR